SLTLGANGAWTYNLNNGASSVQALGANDHLTDTITVQSADGTTSQVTVTINGTNDAAVIGGTAAGVVKEDTTLSVGGTLTVTDVDGGQATFQAGTLAGTYGSLTLGANGAWTYNLNNGASSVQALGANDHLTDTITVQSADGTTSQGTITINGT